MPRSNGDPTFGEQFYALRDQVEAQAAMIRQLAEALDHALEYQERQKKAEALRKAPPDKARVLRARMALCKLVGADPFKPVGG